MVHFLPVAGSWRCKWGIYQRHQVTWQRWVFMASFLIHDPHTRQSDGGGDGEIFKPPAHPKVSRLGPISPTAALCLLPLLACHPGSPWATKCWPPHGASPTAQPPLADSLLCEEQPPAGFLPKWGCCSHLSSSCRDLLLFLSPAQACGRCLVWVLNTFHLSHDDGVLKCCNIC